MARIITGTVSRIGTHVGADFDGAAGIWIAKVFGTHLWRGVETAPIVFHPDRDLDGLTGNDLLRDEEELCIDWGGGDLDEHVSGACPRKEGECATTLVAKTVGQFYNPCLGPIIKYAYSRDTGMGVTETEFAQLFKLANRYAPGTEAEMNQKWSDILFGAFIFLSGLYKELCRRAVNGPIPNIDPVPTMDEVCARWLCRKAEVPFENLTPGNDAGLTETAANYLRLRGKKEFARIVSYGMKRRDPQGLVGDHMFELAKLFRFAFEEIGSQGAEKELEVRELFESVFLFLDGLYAKEYSYHVVCREEFGAETTHTVDLLHPRGYTMPITSVVSSSKEIAKFCRSEVGGFAGVVIVFQYMPYGSVTFQILTDKRRCGATLKYVVKSLRAAQRIRKGYTEILSDEIMMAEGNVVEGASEIFFDAPRQQIFNGSLTAFSQPTMLSRELVEVLTLAGLIREFREMTEAVQTETQEV